jgi:type VI secretion system protein ImpH
MASETRNPPDDLDWLARLEEAPWEFDFLQAVRRLDNLRADMPRTGEAARVAEEPLRFAQQPYVTFAPNAVAGFERAPRGPDRLSVFFMGVFGPHGPLPLHLSEYAIERQRQARDETLARFCDVFHHRMIAFFYRAWAEAQPTVSHDRPAADHFQDKVASLVGLGLPSLRDRGDLPDALKLFFAGRLACQTRNAEGLAAMVGAILGLPAAVQEFVGEWAELPLSSRWQLGRTSQPGYLGMSSVLGGKAWQVQQKFRVVLGPLTQEQYRAMLPGSDGETALRGVVDAYVGDELTWDVRLTLAEGDSFVLGRVGKLGWSTWLKSTTAGVGQDYIYEPGRHGHDKGVGAAA